MKPMNSRRVFDSKVQPSFGRAGLHADAVALWTFPLAVSVVDVALEFLHLNSAFLAGHQCNGRIGSRNKAN
jgi:hypothetical protein